MRQLPIYGFVLLCGDAVPVTVRGRPWACEVSRLKQILHNRLIDGGGVASLKLRQPLPQEDAWYSFLLESKLATGPQCDWKD
jgi:hypothetical protein